MVLHPHLSTFTKESQILIGVTETVSVIDDVLVFSKYQEEHDKHLVVVLGKIQKAPKIG